MSTQEIAATRMSNPKKKDADFVFYELTRSICPDCRKVIDAQVIMRDDKVYMRKRCPHCGPFEALVYGSGKAECPKCKSKKLAQQLSVFAMSAKASASVSPAAGPCGSCGDPRGPGACSMADMD